MSNDLDMQRKMSEIGARYLVRTSNEVADLRRHVTTLAVEGRSALKAIEMLSHRIHGSGAVFGFGKVSDVAGQIEMLAVQGSAADVLDAAMLAAQFSGYIQQLAAETEFALARTQNSLDAQVAT
jgi:chemotaxis protein histidine kinase CheA